MKTENESEQDNNNAGRGKKAVPYRRIAIGVVIGLVIGGAVGYFIDTLFTSDPYIGIRVGSFLGGIIGAQIAAGTGIWGIGVMMVMVVCSTVGVVVPLLIWKPDVNNFLACLPMFIGGIAGAFIGLILGLLVFKRAMNRNSTEA